uniref:Capsid protein n=1 Tax=Parvoviridae sp. TaxID=1940570 RepID=A0A7D3QRJ5_9VIRU|nr:MAG: hypothetical protein [Parvoviridae sp.]
MGVEPYSISNSWLAYIQNQPYQYPNDNNSLTGDGVDFFNTGWHILPNMLWKHLVTPKQWSELTIKAEAYHVESITTTVFNMVPMTTQLAIQSTNVFTAFNNTIYALGYTDDLYETNWKNWYPHDFKLTHSLLYKEGLVCEVGANTKKRNMLPIYGWRIPNTRPLSKNSYNNRTGLGLSSVYPAGQNNPNETNFDQRPSGCVWDPMNRPNNLKELRPGKNSINFTWTCHPSDEGKWFNLDMIAAWHPYTPEGPYNIVHPRPGEYKLSAEMDPDRVASKNELAPPVNDYTMPDFSNLPVVPMAWWWQEMKNSMAPATMDKWQLKYMDLFFTGTEKEQYMYGPNQHFIKIVPIFDSAGTHIECSALVGVKTTLNLQIKNRRSALYCPTWGPFNWFSTYSACSTDMQYTGAWIRYRTGGMRRTWQNLADSSNISAHPRETPFVTTEQNPSGSGQDGTRSTLTYTRAAMPTAPPMDLDRVPITSAGIQPLEHITGHRV